VLLAHVKAIIRRTQIGYPFVDLCNFHRPSLWTEVLNRCWLLNQTHQHIYL